MLMLILTSSIGTQGLLFRKVYTNVGTLEEEAGSVVLTSPHNGKQDCAIICSYNEECGGTYFDSASGNN